MTLAVTKSMADGKQKIQERLSIKGEDRFRLTQIWPTGSKWWSRYLKDNFDSQLRMLAVTVGNSEIHWGAVENGLQLGISVEDFLTHGGDPIHVKIALRNTSDVDVPLQPLLLDQNLRVEVVDSDNNPSVLTELGKAIKQAPLSFSTAKILPAHSTLYGEVTISNIDDMTIQGDYSIRVFAEPTRKVSQQLTTPVLSVRVLGQIIAPKVSNSQSVTK